MKDFLIKQLKFIYSGKVQAEDARRIPALDLAKGFAIILVVMGHFVQTPYAVNRWLSTFELPLFFLVSGILICVKKEEEKSISVLLKRKAKGILVPYVWFTLMTIAMVCLRLLFGRGDGSVIRTIVIQTVTLEGYSVLWFLPVIFLAEMLVLLLLKKMDARLSALLLTAAAIGGYYGYLALEASFGGMEAQLPAFLYTLRTVEKSFIAASFVNYGYLLAILGTRMKEILEIKTGTKKPVFYGVQLAAGIILLAVTAIVAPVIGIQDLNDCLVGFLPTYLAVGTCGAVGLLLLCGSIPNLPLITFYGRNSLIIMCTHMNLPLLHYGSILGEMCDNRFRFGAENVSLCIYTILFTFILEIPVIYVINCFLPFVMGRSFGWKKTPDTVVSNK